MRKAYCWNEVQDTWGFGKITENLGDLGVVATLSVNHKIDVRRWFLFIVIESHDYSYTVFTY